MVFIIKENVSNSLKNFQGSTDEEVVLSKEKYGLNKLTEKKKESLILKILSIFKKANVFITYNSSKCLFCCW